MVRLGGRFKKDHFIRPELSHTAREFVRGAQEEVTSACTKLVAVEKQPRQDTVRGLYNPARNVESCGAL